QLFPRRLAQQGEDEAPDQRDDRRDEEDQQVLDEGFEDFPEVFSHDVEVEVLFEKEAQISLLILRSSFNKEGAPSRTPPPLYDFPASGRSSLGFGFFDRFFEA